MPRSEHSKSFSVSAQGERFNPTQKMQRQSDSYTKKYEWERRNLHTLKGIESNLKDELAKLKESVTKLKKQTDHGKVKVTFTKSRNIQKQIDHVDKRYNDAMGEIDRMRRDITLMRQEKTMYQRNMKELQEDIEKNDFEITQKMKEIEQTQSFSKINQEKMMELKMQNEKNKTFYYQDLRKLNKQLRDPKFIQGSRIKTGEVTAIQNDTATTLKQRLTKLILNNKEKVRLIDNYQRNMKVIDDAFNTIKEATGLTDIGEIQNTFIKGEEQNYNLLTYVDVLNQQIDNIVDINETLRQQNTALKKQNEEKEQILTGTPDDEKKRQKIVAINEANEKEIVEFQQMLDKIQPNLKQALIKLASSKFNKENPYKIQQYENSGLPLNDQTLAEYLAELEDYTNDILLYRGKAMNHASPELYAKTLLLQELNPKQFKKRMTDNTPLYTALDDTKDKAKGIERLLDRDLLEDMAKRDLEKSKATEAVRKKK